MTTVAATALVLVTVWLFVRLGAVRLARDVFAGVRRALADVRDPALDDDAKERALRAHSGRLFVAFLRMTLLAAVAVALPIGALALLAMPGWVDFDMVLDAALSWPVLLTATAAGIALLWAARQRR